MRSWPFLALLALVLGCGDLTVIENEPTLFEGDDPGECSDGADNDQDGLFDCDDTDCAASPDCGCDDTDGDGVCDDEDQCPGEDDTLDTDGDGVPDCLDPCPDDALDDADGDGVCDSDDLCPGEDDILDTDGDGVPDCLDPCPNDDPDDSDGDGVCDSTDVCPGGDDTVDTDGDGTPDDCEQCLGSSGWSLPDTDGDGLPDDCLLSVLLEDNGSWVSDNIEAMLLARGWTVNYQPGAVVAAMTDFSAYDVVALVYPGTINAHTSLITANDLGEVGLLLHRSGNSGFVDYGLGGSSFYQLDSCSVTNNSHFVTQPFAVGPLPLDYAFKTWVETTAAGTTTLLGCPLPSLVVHPTVRRLTTPYYGHETDMPWNADGELIDLRSYAWAAGFGAQ